MPTQPLPHHCSPDPRRSHWLLALGLACSVVACSAEPVQQSANVILVVFDTTRFDDWSIMSPEKEITPVLDRLAAEGQRFQNAYSLYTSTVPSHVSLFTGHAILPRSEVQSPLRDPRYGYRASSLFTILGEKGYRTYAFSGNKNIHSETIDALKTVHVTSLELHEAMSESRLKEILNRYGEYIEEPELLSDEARFAYDRNRRVIMGSGENVTVAALAAMEDHASEYREAPYFLFLNYNDAHDPYFPNPEYANRFETSSASEFNGNLWNPEQRVRAPRISRLRLSMTAQGLRKTDILRARQLHLAELAYADHQFGLLLNGLERLGLLESTIIIAVADHGELFGEHGRMAHSGLRVEELLHVPLFMRFPDPTLQPATVDAHVDLRDIKPTLLDYLGIDDASSRGRSLLPLIRGTVAELSAPAETPSRTSTEAGSEHIIDGQDPETTQKLIKQLRELGYIE